jgi:serine phosphatase RsbU (regulator of sigma subunit)/PAS domain-containing protein
MRSFLNENNDYFKSSMNQFSILLIEEQISVTAEILLAIGRDLDAYTLSIARTITEVIREPEPTQVILISLCQLKGDVSAKLSQITRTYPHVPIILLISGSPAQAEDEGLAIEALLYGASDYTWLSEKGLAALGRRLAILKTAWLDQEHHRESFFGDLICQAIANDTSDMGMQLIGADHRVRAWNQAAEAYFEVEREQVIGRSVDELPLSAGNISRLKDILDHIEATRQPFFIPVCPLEGSDSRWVHVHVYPIYRNLLTRSDERFTDVCIVSTKVPDLTGIDSESIYHNQELQALLEANREISGQLELDAALERAIEQTKSLLNGDNCQIYFLEKDNQSLRPVRTQGPLSEIIEQTPLSLTEGVLGQAAASGQAAILNYTGSISEIPYADDAHLMCAPLTALKGTMGLMVISRSRVPFTHDDLRFFESLVQQASSAINNARLFEETARSLNELAILYEASLAISSHWDDQSVLNTLIQQMVQAIEVSNGFIASWNREDNKGFIEAQFANDQISQGESQASLDQVIDLSERPALLTMINQQRPIFLHLSNPSLDGHERREMESFGCRSRLIVPLLTKGETIGWLELWDTRQEHSFAADEVRMSRALSSQVAVALQNTHYLQQTQQTLEETTALYRVASALATLQDPQAIMSTVLQEYLQALNLKQGSVVIFDYVTKVGIVKAHIQDEQPFKRVVAQPAQVPAGNESGYRVLEGRQIPLQNNPVYERLMRNREPVVIDDTNAEWLTAPPLFAPKLEIPPAGGWGDEAASAILIIPIKIRVEIVGVLVAENTRYARPFNQWIISLGQAMADQLGVGLQNVELFEAEYRRREQAETLREVSAIVSSSLNLNEVLEAILDQLGRVIKYDSAAIQLIAGNYRRIIAGRGFPNPEEVIGKTFPMSDKNEPGVIAIGARQPLVYGNITDIYTSFRDPVPSEIKSWMGVPLVARDRVIGLISIDHVISNAYSDEDVQLAVAFANQAAIAIENARLYEIEVREIERGLDIAHQIQSTLLPQYIPQIPGLDIVGRIIPARQVGGDFFHFFSTAPDQLGVAIGDVSGKGIPAALYMAAGITAIDTQIGTDLLPGELLNNLNKMLYNRLHENKMNIALQIATFIPLPTQNDDQSGEQAARGSLMTVASAGMIAPVGATEFGCRFLPVSGLPIGALPDAQIYADDVFLLDPLTTIIFTSDGIVEAQNEVGELFGFERLEETILEIISKRNAEQIADHIIHRTQQFIGHAEQHDDMTVVVVVKK